MSTLDNCPHCGSEPLMTPSEIESNKCLVCVFSPPDREPEPVSEDVLLHIARKWFWIGVECCDCGARYRVEGPWDGVFRCMECQ